MKSEANRKKKSREPLPDPRYVDVQPTDYQPNKAEVEAETDMPDASRETVRRAFFRPILPKHKGD